MQRDGLFLRSRSIVLLILDPALPGRLRGSQLGYNAGRDVFVSMKSVSLPEVVSG